MIGWRDLVSREVVRKPSMAFEWDDITTLWPGELYNTYLRSFYHRGSYGEFLDFVGRVKTDF